MIPGWQELTGAPCCDDGPVDPRALRTRSRLQEALLALARERPLDEVTIGDIATRAAVNRSSFYQHYPDKETLLADALDAQATAAGADLSDMTLTDVGTDPPAALLRYFRHIAENAAVYRQALGGAGVPGPAAQLRHRLQTIIAGTTEAFGIGEADTGVPLDVFAAGFAGSLLGVAAAWLRRDPLPAPEVAAGWAWSLLLRRDF